MPLDLRQGPFAFQAQTVNCRDLFWRQHAALSDFAKKKSKGLAGAARRVVVERQGIPET
jgi:hypothetical protein